MKRYGLLAAVGLLLVAAPLCAQESTSPPPARLSITPFVGVRTPFISKGTVTLELGGETTTAGFGQTPPEQSGGLAAGAEVELRLAGPLSVLSAASYSRVGVPFGYETGESGPTAAGLWLAKAALAVRLPEPKRDTRIFRPSAVLSIGPAVVREDPRDLGSESGYGELTKPINHWALNLGAKAVSPVATRVGFQLGFENFVTFWNDAERDRRLEQVFRDQAGVPVTVHYRSDVSHIFLITAGLSLRL